MERPPRVLLVGGSSILGRRRLRRVLEVETVGLERAEARLADGPPDVLVLDGGLAPGRMQKLLERLEAPGSPLRPAVVVVAPSRRRERVESLLRDQVDDYVDGSAGQGELLFRVRAALRVRGYRMDLGRKDADLLHLNGRLEALARRMAEEMRLAANVQRSLLPAAFQHPRLDMAREFIPFREIGGDYYDLVPLGPGRLAFAIGDVMGKGVAAALLAANLKACLRGQLQTAQASPESLVTRVNRLFWEVTPKGIFASLFFGIFDLDRGTLEYVNAGHDYPFLVAADGRMRDLVQGGTVLGLMEDSSYERAEVPILSGDRFVFYSDGVTDRGNPDGEVYGVERLKAAALRSREDDARIMLYTLLGEIQGWSAGALPEDDMTLIVARVL